MAGILAGKTALVTGGTRGIGRAIVEQLAAEGAHVAFNYATSSKAAEEIVAAIEAGGGKAFALQAELGTDESIEGLVNSLNEQLTQRTGAAALDILVNNIGGGVYATTETTTDDQYHTTFSNNVRVPFKLTQLLMSQIRDGGRVVNISSAAEDLGEVNTTVYAMSKSALNTFTRMLAKEVGRRNITVNAVAPGFTTTDSNAESLAIPEVRKQLEEMTALGWLGSAGDIAAVVLSLVSPGWRWVTGEIIEVSGGVNL